MARNLFTKADIFTGINAIIFHAPFIFQSLGFGSRFLFDAVAIIVNSISSVTTYVAAFTFSFGGFIISVHQIRTALLIGRTNTILGQDYSGGAMASSLPCLQEVPIVACICVSVFGYALSWSVFGWLIPTEILPLEIRSAGVVMNMTCNFIITLFFLQMLSAMKRYLFFLSSLLVLVMTRLVADLLPETDSVPLEQMFRIWRNHWFWGRYTDQDHTPQCFETSLLPM